MSIINRLLLSCWLSAATVAAYGQTSDDATSASDGPQALLSEDWWSSARATSMGGALAPVADGMDAPYYNPAGIGGLHLGKKDVKSAIRFFGFPYVAAGAGEDSAGLPSQFTNFEEAASQPVVRDAVAQAAAGKSQYARFSLVPSVVFNRFTLGYIMDDQIAAVPRPDGMVRLHRSNRSGPLVGFSATDPNGTLYIGGAAAILTRTDIAGDVNPEDIADSDRRGQALSSISDSYSGTSSTAGLLWRMSKKGNPTLSLVARDIGDTVYTGSGANITATEDVSLGFGYSPKLGKWGYFNGTIEAKNLLNPEAPVDKKLATGLELTIGDTFGWAAGSGIRVGADTAGASYGAHVNLGFLGFQASSYAVDIGSASERQIERRNVGIFSVNVAH